jgi:hypothetical protein
MFPPFYHKNKMNGVKIEWYRFVDTYDMFHRNGFRSGHNFVINVETEVTDELIARMTDIVPDMKIISKQHHIGGANLYVAVESDAEAVALKMGII